MVGRSLFEFIPEQQRLSVADHLREVCRQRGSLRSRNQTQSLGGGARWIEWTNSTLTDETGQVTAIHSVGRDVDLQVLAEEKLRTSEERYRLLAENGADMVFQLDLDLKRTYVSPACFEILGYQPEELVGANPVNMIHPDDAQRVDWVFRSLLDEGREQDTVVNRIRRQDGRWIWVEARFRALKDSRTGAVIGVSGALRDISHRKAVEDQLAEANRRLEILAGEDGLTGLANRRTFDDALRAETRRARRERRAFGVIMLDVDCFKQLNDLYGHPFGDECLRRISAVIKESIHRPGDLAARYGGEEFAVVLPNADEAQTATVADRIRLGVQALQIPHRGAGPGVVTISCGVAAVAPGDATTEDALLQRADRALYQAKDSGRNATARASRIAEAKAS